MAGADGFGLSFEGFAAGSVRALSPLGKGLG
jgi:hypothetical protein